MSSSQSLKAGSYLKYYCTKCGLDLGHTVIAVMNGIPVRVKCNTCKSERNYKTPKVAEVLKTRERGPRPKIVRPDVYAQKVNSAKSRHPKAYRIDEYFELNDLVDHPKFGRGVVTKAIFPDRVEILFQDQSRVLLAKLEAPPSNESEE